MLEILNNEEFNDPNIQLPKQKMKKGTKRVLIFGFAFLIAMYAILSSVQSMVGIFESSFANVKTYIGYLNEPYNIEEIIPSKITEDDYNMFVIKANGAGFGVFGEDGKIDLSEREVGLNNNLSLTEKELGALIKEYITSLEINLFDLMQLDIYKQEPEPIIIEGEDGEDIVIDNPVETSILKMKTVFKINLEMITSIAEQVPNFLKPVIESLPNEIYVTTEYDVVEGMDGKFIESKNGKQQINALTEDKNEAVLGLIIAIFGGVQNYDAYEQDASMYEMAASSFLDIFTSMVSDTIETINDRTGGTFKFVVGEDEVNTVFMPKQEEI